LTGPKPRLEADLHWLELSAPVDAEAVDEVVSLLGRYSHGSPVIEEKASPAPGERPFIVKAYLACDGSLASKKRRLFHDLERLPSPYVPQLQERLLNPEDWSKAWKAHFLPHKVGEHIVIRPSWHSYNPSPSEIVIELDPGMAFGTGLHPSTRLCLLRLERHLEAGMPALDLGTGSGILAIAAAKLGASPVLALDIDPIAVKVARANTRANGLGEIVEVKRGTLSPKMAAGLRGHFALVVANITARVIAELAESLALVLKPGGRLIAGGITGQGLDEVLICLALAGLRAEAIDRDGEWHTVMARGAQRA